MTIEEANPIRPYTKERTQKYFDSSKFIRGKAYRIVRSKCEIEGLLLSVGDNNEPFPTHLTFLILDTHRGPVAEVCTRLEIVHIEDMNEYADESIYTEIYELQKGVKINTTADEEYKNASLTGIKYGDIFYRISDNGKFKVIEVDLQYQLYILRRLDGDEPFVGSYGYCEIVRDFSKNPIDVGNQSCQHSGTPLSKFPTLWNNTTLDNK